MRNLNQRPDNVGSEDPRLCGEATQNTSHGLSRRGPKMNRGNAGSFDMRDPNQERWQNEQMAPRLRGK